MPLSDHYGKRLFILLLLSALVRSFVAILLELGNDEVYYWTYALYPDLSHFDHPPMVGWLIRLFTFNLSLQDEFFVRLTSVVLGTFNTYLIYCIGKALLDQRTGWFSALLYTSSIYASILVGTFILPDTPQVFYWLLSLYFLLLALNDKLTPRFRNLQWIMAGLAIGLALLSKYTSVFLWIGVLFYAVLLNKSVLRNPFLYLAVLISFAIFSPVIVWNLQNDFISISFHSSRVGFGSVGIEWDYFLREIFGQLLYNNPFTVIIIVISLVHIFKNKELLKNTSIQVLLFISLPLILLFLFFSLFQSTLPHWSGPAYVTLIVPSAVVMRQFYDTKMRMYSRLRNILSGGLLFLILIIIVGVIQVRLGLFYNGKEEEMQKLGSNDISLDMYGWDQVRESFAEIKKNDELNKVFDTTACLFSYRWFPAANIDYYVARPNEMPVFAIGDLERIHKYAWINEARGGFYLGMDGYFITTSRDFKDPNEIFSNFFEKIEPLDPIPIVRNKKTVQYLFIYRLHNLKTLPR